MKSIMPAICLLLLAFSSLYAQKRPLDSLFSLGLAASEAGDVSNGTAYYLQAQKLAEQLNDKKMLCRLQVGLGKIGLISENNQMVQDAVDKAGIFCTECGDTVSFARSLLVKGVLYIKRKQMDSAMIYMQNSASLFFQVRDTMAAMNSLAKVGNVLEVQGKWKEATPYYQRYYDASLRAQDSKRLLTSSIYLSGNYLYLNELDKAAYYNDKVIEVSKRLGANYEYSEGLRQKALLLNKQGQYKEAFTALNRFALFYQDTLMNDQRLKENEQLKAQYEAEKKESLIAVQQEELKQEKWRFWTTLALLGIALVAGIVLFMLTRRLRQRNQEKEFLIKEIHHRVKNNLQILSSLLHLQSRQITDDAALDAVREGQNRVDAMGLIHQKLYMGDNVAKVEMKEYLEQFGQNMLDSFGIEEGRISIDYDLQAMYLDVDTAIPLSLIINELVTNSLKYAFPDERAGKLRIALWQDDKNRLCLRVADNGVGYSTAGKGTSFGSNLIQMLSKKLKGTPVITQNAEGYATEIVFEKAVLS